MFEKIQAALDRLFIKHRLIFWYDEKGEMQQFFEQISPDTVRKITISGNEFYIKYLVLVEDTESKFLIYQQGPKPALADNWLLDLNLAYYEFHADPSSLYLQELGLPQELRGLVEQHAGFFRNADRLQRLKELVEADDLETKLRLKMMAVVCNTEPAWEKILYSLFEEILRPKPQRFNELAAFSLDAIIWDYAEKKYGYKSLTPAVKDLAVQLLLHNFRKNLPFSKTSLTKDAYIFVNSWKENTRAQEVFESISNQFSQELGIENEISETPVEDLLEVNTFAFVEKRILVGIRDHLLAETLGNQVVQEWIGKRRTKFFYKDFENLYTALSYGSAFLDEIKKTVFSFIGLAGGFNAYVKQHHRADFLYRKYINHAEAGEHQNLLKDLTAKIENAYTNSFLLPLAGAWQRLLDSVKNWQIPDVESQNRFYDRFVQPYVDRGHRVFVIISDAFRYEAAAEFRELLLREDRYTAELTPVLGMLPSYTQLGMAALLPHKTLSYENSDTVYADGKSTIGLENRTKVLEARYAASIAINAEDLLAMKAHDQGREFVKPYQVIYIYHNGIDKTGDDKISEGNTFRAVEEEFRMLMKIIKQVANMNGNNMIITSDHGFLYQQDRLDTTDFNETAIKGDTVKVSRRYVIGRNLAPSPALMTFTSAALGIGGDLQVQIPKSVNRLRVQGAGSRFVHGGAALQEIVLPVLEVNKKRKSDVEYVQVEVLGGSTTITSNRFGVNFYQRQPVGDKLRPVQLRGGFYTQSGKLISDLVTLNCNSTDTDAAAREQRHLFLFVSEATQYNNQEIVLRIEEPVEGTSVYRTYQEKKYRMLISFGSEFDEF